MLYHYDAGTLIDQGVQRFDDWADIFGMQASAGFVDNKQRCFSRFTKRASQL